MHGDCRSVFATGKAGNFDNFGIFGLLGLVVAGGFSCGDSPKDRFIGAYCDLFRPCCAAAGLKSDGQLCRLVLALTPSGYNQTEADACLAELRAASSGSTFCASINLKSEACSKALPSSGTKAPGATCTSDFECAASTEGKVSCAMTVANGAVIQKCQIQLRGQLGSAPCAETVDGPITSSFYVGASDVAPRGYLCDLVDGLSCTGGTCVQLRAVGEMCTGVFTSDCMLAAYCDPSQRVCAARKAAGVVCRVNGNECVKGTFCRTSTAVCSTQLAIGAACTESAECLSDNCVNGTCKPGFADVGLLLSCGSTSG